MRSEIMEAIRQAIDDADPPPQNEAETCHRIIYPLLRAAGYAHREIRSQGTDATGQRPDYTILPDLEEHTWYLEAKAWHFDLADSHAQQAINYANTEGKRWVVLTNGKEWRLYDNHINAVAATRLAARIWLADESFGSFLEAVSRSSVTQGRLESFVRNQRLYSALPKQLADPRSGVVRAIRKVLRDLPGLGNVSGDEIVGFFRDGPALMRDAGEGPISATAEATDIASQQTPPATRHSDLNLSEVKESDVTGKRPATLILADGTAIHDERWYVITKRLVEHVLTTGRLTQIPLFKGRRARSPCVAYLGADGTEAMRTPETVSANGREYVVETHFSAIDHVKLWRVILAASGLSASDCRLSLSAERGRAG